MDGRIHSIETAGMVDGPGIRFVIFTQGCLLRCQFCHNPDTWNRTAGEVRSVASIMEEIKKYVPYMKRSGGGVTVSGGEPLLQQEFLLALFKECKKLGIHTTIDSSGGCYSAGAGFQKTFQELLQYTDLVLVDLKQMNDEKHRVLTGVSNKHILAFAEQLSEAKVPVWIRHVLVPGKYEEKDLRELHAFIATLQNVEKVEILPYHKLGVYKWEQMGLDYPLKGVETPSEKEVARAKELLHIV